ncbi:uncharacterized protein J3D65DRAFT_606949 [Phyllosticta citribraziliensis]|uniref:Uncharacterized protein n=1 Tax=Phyllosticta citribraziliensis TaxID=989973 RepID=A0ABR1L7R7_9PEZI
MHRLPCSGNAGEWLLEHPENLSQAVARFASERWNLSGGQFGFSIEVRIAGADAHELDEPNLDLLNMDWVFLKARNINGSFKWRLPASSTPRSQIQIDEAKAIARVVETEVRDFATVQAWTVEELPAVLFDKAQRFRLSQTRQPEASNALGAVAKKLGRSAIRQSLARPFDHACVQMLLLKHVPGVVERKQELLVAIIKPIERAFSQIVETLRNSIETHKHLHLSLDYSFVSQAWGKAWKIGLLNQFCVIAD